MKRMIIILSLFQFLNYSCLAQDITKINRHKSEAGVSYYQTSIDYLECQTDIIAINAIIEVNGIVHPRDTYGYIKYINSEGIEKRCIFQYLGGAIIVSEKDFDAILKLPDTSQVEIAICLQSPINGDWGGYWEMVMVKGLFDVNQLSITRNKFMKSPCSHFISPCFHFIITSIGKELFKIQFESWKVQTYYYSVDSCLVTSRQRKRLDRKERNIYRRANMLDFERKIW